MSGNEYFELAKQHDPEKAKRIERQYSELWATATVTCSCGLPRHFTHAYRCLYCGEYFCFNCAEKHFGKTVKRWMGEKHPEIEMP